MSAKTIAQFAVMPEVELSTVEGGWSGWGAALAGLLGGLAPSPSLDQLNGKWPIRRPSRPCSPYGTGGTPNACNGF